MRKIMIHEVKRPLRIVGGKFMRGNEEVRVEIGNAEQIALLQSIDRRQRTLEREALENGLECECEATNITYTSQITFDCVCGEEVEDDQPIYGVRDWEELEYTKDDWDGKKLTCKACGRKYAINDGKAKLLKR